MANPIKITAAEVSTAMAFMMAQRGKPYSEDLSRRLGPNAFDCSGLVYQALHKMGLNIPQSESTADTEANWLGANGAQVIKSESQVKTGDIVFFHGAAPRESNYGLIGHVGMAIDNGHMISAYDTHDGILVTPISQDQFTVAMRLSGDTIAPGAGGASPAPGGGGGILGIDWGNIPQDFQDFDTMIKFILSPSSWVRIVAFLAGILVLLFAVHALIAVGKGEPLISMPSTIPVPV